MDTEYSSGVGGSTDEESVVGGKHPKAPEDHSPLDSPSSVRADQRRSIGDERATEGTRKQVVVQASKCSVDRRRPGAQNTYPIQREGLTACGVVRRM